MRHLTAVLLLAVLGCRHCTAVYVYVQRSTLGFTEGLDAAHEGAVSLSGDGNTIAVGGYDEDGGVGAAWVYTRANTISLWEPQGVKLVGTGAVGTSHQGRVALSSDGNTLAVGGPDDAGGVGATWVFARVDGVWQQQGEKLVGTDAVGAAAQATTTAISGDGNTLAVGGPADAGGVGGTWVFVRVDGVWKQQCKKLVGTGPGGTARQGDALAVSEDGNALAVGGYNTVGPAGGVWVFTRDGTAWTQKFAKVGVVDGYLHGFAVSLDAGADSLAVGAYAVGNGSSATYRRATLVYNRWDQQGALVPGVGLLEAGYPGSVALSSDGGTLAVGGFLYDGAVGTRIYKATWIYVHAAGTWLQQGSKTAAFNTSSLPFTAKATALSANGSVLAVGTSGSSAQVFDRQGLTGAPCNADEGCAGGNCARGRCFNLAGAPCTTYNDCLSHNCGPDKTCLCLESCLYPACGGCEEADVCTSDCTCRPGPAPNTTGPAPAATAGKRSKVGLIAGSAAGSAALLALAVAIALLWRRRVRRRAHALAPPQKLHTLDGHDAFAQPLHPQWATGVTHFTSAASWSSKGRSTLSQRECGTSKDERKALLLRQLRHAGQSGTVLLGAFELLGDAAQHRRVGGQGVVQFVCDPDNKDRQFALKFYLDAASFDTERRHLTNASLKHVTPPLRAIVSNEDGGIQILGRPLPPFVATERGESLEEWRRRKNLNADLNFSNAMNIVLHLVQRVGELHAAGLAHRDLKPGNVILLPSRNEWTVIDYGSEAAIGSQAPMSLTVAYAAPETVLAWANKEKNVVADAAVDVWALGLIAFELLTLTPVHAGDRHVIVQTMRGKLPLPWEDTRAADFGANMRSLGFMKEGILRMLSRDAGARPSLRDVHCEWNSHFKRGAAADGAEMAHSAHKHPSSGTEGLTSTLGSGASQHTSAAGADAPMSWLGLPL